MLTVTDIVAVRLRDVEECKISVSRVVEVEVEADIACVYLSYRCRSAKTFGDGRGLLLLSRSKTSRYSLGK